MEKVGDKKAVKEKVAYELSYIGKIPAAIPYQPGFRHLTTLLQINNLDVDKVVKYFEKELKNQHDKKRLRTRAWCAKNWLQKYAPEEFTFSVQEKSAVQLTAPQKKLIHDLAQKLLEREWTDVDLHEEMYVLCKNHDISPQDFFKAAYKILINKEKGPRLAAFILEIGRKKVAALFKNV